MNKGLSKIRRRVTMTEEQILRSVKYFISPYRGKANAVEKKNIAEKVFGYYNSTSDRLTRDAVSTLQDQGELICTNSGAGGWYYAATASEVEEYLAEIDSRIVQMQQKKKAMWDAAYRKFRGKEIVRPGQPTLL